MSASRNLSLLDHVPVASGASTSKSYTEKISIQAIVEFDPRALLAMYSERTSDITTRIYNRAGVYLFVGVVISFTGLAFFYVRTAQTSYDYKLEIESQTSTGKQLREESSVKDAVGRLVVLLPGFGILFFIEFIAFFFLRQYRSAMDEFRYFDAIRRNREENLVILKMFTENTNITPTEDVLGAMRMYSSAGILESGQTTDIIETKKLQKDELIIFEKLIDIMSTLRNAEPKGEVKNERK